MAVSIPRRKFTVSEYYRMAKAGILGEDDRVELLDGEIIQMSPIGPPHGGTVNRVNRLFGRLVGNRALVAVQNPVRLDTHSEPEPDIALLTPRTDDYARSHPRPGDVLLIVEVADTTAIIDRRIKLPLYARSGIAEVWLLVLNRTRQGRRSRSRTSPVLEVHRNPGPNGYAETRLVRRGERIAPLALPDMEIDVAELLGDDESAED